MSQSGYGYGGQPGYHPGPTYPILPYPSYPPSSHYSNDPADGAPHVHGDAAPPSYDYNRSTIPGLGLSFPASGTEQQSPWPRPQPGNWYSTPQLPPESARGSNQGPVAGGPSEPATAIRDGAVGDGLEEGEISEGEIEELYEPKDVEDDAAEAQAWPYGRADLGHVDSAMDRQDALLAGGSSRPEAALERSGSYSPYLSPREVSQTDPVHEDSFSSLNQTTPQTSSSNEAMNPPSGAPVPSPATTASAAKRQAQDAILRLWHLHVRFQDYLQEGIDGTILGHLFDDLGLDVHADTDMLQGTKAGDSRAEPPAPSASEGVNASNASKAPPTRKKPVDAQPAKAANKTEERKDRIARLLAAKGSKPAVATPVAAPATSPSAAPPPSITRAQSEKSKLLQQKMEALKRSREALARSRSQPASSEPQAAQVETEQKTETPDAAAASLNSSEESSFPETSDRAAGSGKPSPSIPGLFLSAPRTPQTAWPASQQRCLPAKTSTSDPSAKSSRRHFGQNMKFRPFLINVSDDEDDAEMDIDSPGHLSPPANRPDTPAQRPDALRDVSSVSNNIMAHHAPSPAFVATSPRSLCSGSGGKNLASMNRKIEAMKRKIAEAEARKKAKRSRQVSPTASHSNGSTRDESAEAASIARGSIAAALSTRGSRTPANDFPAESAASPMPQERRIVSEECSGPDRRRRSRAASERLPFIEARRREQLLKLKSLQSQIAKIERDIEEGMREEEMLKQDLVDPDSGQDRSQAVSQAAAPSSAERGLSAQPVEESSQSDESTGSSPIVNESGSSHSDAAATDSESHPGTTQNAISPEDGERCVAGRSEGGSMVPVGQVRVVNEACKPSAQPEDEEPGPMQDAAQDVTMKESADSTGGEMEETDDYEPPDAESSSVEGVSPSWLQSALANEQVATDSTNHAKKGDSGSAAMTRQISAGQAQSMPEPDGEEIVPLTQLRPEHRTSEQARQQRQSPAAGAAPRSHFVSYETPLQYFHAYRFHPEFNQTVGGGLRSLTYSNKIDVRKELCPDELAGRQCPRGSECEYQHFESMKAPDDQILLQLGAAGNYQDEQKQEYITGLRHLLTEFRNRKVKDFSIISQGIIDYRARFLGDRSKILPLGGVTI